MGALLSCGAQDEAERKKCCACFSDAPLSYERSIGEICDQDEAAGESLSGFVLEPDAVDSLGDALEELQEAARLFREGLCTEAAEKLAEAEKHIEEAPSTPSRKRISVVSMIDPDLQELKQMTAFAMPVSAASAAAIVDETKEKSEPGFDENNSDNPEDNASPDTDRDSIRQRDDLLAELEVELTNVRALCREARIFEAHDAMERLEAGVAAAIKTDKKMATILQQLDSRLKGDPVLVKLRLIHGRMLEAVKMLKTPSTLSKSEVTLEAKDPKIGEHFRLNLSLRFAEGAERTKDGPATQIIVRGTIRNMPAPLWKIITENTEVDLFQAAWIKDCKKFTGKPGRAPRLFCSLMHLNISPPLLPIKLEDVVLREFSVCKDGDILPDLGAGVIVVEHRAPEGVKEFEGMPIPPKMKGVTRIKGGMSAFYKSQSVHPGCANIVAVSTFGLPVPQFMLPLSLLKKFAADIVLGSTRLMASGLYAHWEELEYAKRGDTNPDFYKLVASLPADNQGE